MEGNQGRARPVMAICEFCGFIGTRGEVVTHYIFCLDNPLNWQIRAQVEAMYQEEYQLRVWWYVRRLWQEQEARRRRLHPPPTPLQLRIQSGGETSFSGRHSKAEKTEITVALIGQVNSGKSTVTGHLMEKLNGYDIETLNTDYNQMRNDDDAAIWRFQTDRYKCAVIDVPGGPHLIKAMISGTSQADCAILMLDSTRDFQPSALYDHSLLAKFLGVKVVVCWLNKMDVTYPVTYSEDLYDYLKTKVSQHLVDVGYNINKITFIPTSGIEGDNLLERSRNLDWYKGPTLIDAIDQMDKPTRWFKPLCMPVKQVEHKSDTETVVIGRVEYGIIRRGMKLVIGPNGSHPTRVLSLEVYKEEMLEALPGNQIQATIPRIENIKRGSVVSYKKEDPATNATAFICQVFILNHADQLAVTKECDDDDDDDDDELLRLKCHLGQSRVKVSRILAKIDRKTGRKIEVNPDSLANGDSGIMEIIPLDPIVIEKISNFPSLARFLVTNSEEQVVAVGKRVE